MNKDAYAFLQKIEDRHWWFVVRREILSKILEKFTSPKEFQVLDIGCGNGGNLMFLSKFGTVVGMEMEEIAVCNHKKDFPNYAVYKGYLPEHVPQDILYRQFDIITMLDVLEHIDDENASLNIITGLLANNGILLVTVPAYNWLWSKSDEIAWHKRRYTKKRLVEKLQASGLEIKFSSYFNTILFPIAVFSRILSKIFKKYDVDKEMEINSILVNNILKFIFGIEKVFLPKISFPFGLSMLAVATKKEINMK